MKTLPIIFLGILLMISCQNIVNKVGDSIEKVGTKVIEQKNAKSQVDDTKSQTVDDYLKPVTNIQDYYFDREESMLLGPAGITFGSELDKNALGLLDYRREPYNIRLGPYDDRNEHSIIIVSILVFSSGDALNKFISSSSKEDIFTPLKNHYLLVGETALTCFYWEGGPDFPVQDKPGYEAYLRVLSHYRDRLGARLLIPPDVDYTEASYFEYWRDFVRN